MDQAVILPKRIRPVFSGGQPNVLEPLERAALLFSHYSMWVAGRSLFIANGGKTLVKELFYSIFRNIWSGCSFSFEESKRRAIGKLNEERMMRRLEHRVFNYALDWHVLFITVSPCSKLRRDRVKHRHSPTNASDFNLSTLVCEDYGARRIIEEPDVKLIAWSSQIRWQFGEDLLAERQFPLLKS